MENNNLNGGGLKESIIKIVTVALFCGLGFWAAGGLGAAVGLIIAMGKVK